MAYKHAKRAGATFPINKIVKVLRKAKANFFRGLNITGILIVRASGRTKENSSIYLLSRMEKILLKTIWIKLLC